MANKVVIEIDVDAKDAQAEFKKTQSGFANLRQGIQKHSRAIGVGMTAVGVGIVAIGGLAIKSFASFEQSIAKAGAVANASSDEMELFAKIAKQMGATTKFSAAQAAEALTFLSMAGFAVEESTAALPGVLQLAAAANLELGAAADIASNVLSGFGLEVDQLARVNDVMAKAFTSANTDLIQLGQAMKMAGPVASAAGVSFEETTAALALMGNAGIQAGLAGTSLRGAIARLLTPTDDAAAALSKIGVTATDSSGNLRSLTEIIGQLERGGLTAGDAMTIFGQRAGPAMLALISQGQTALIDFTNNLENAGGTAGRIAERQLATFQGSILKLQSALEGIAISIGGLLAPMLQKFADLAQRIIGSLIAWTEKHQTLTKILAIAIAAIGGLMLVLGPLLLILPTLAAGMALLAGASGIGLVVLAVAAVSIGVVLLLKNWDRVFNAMKQITETVVNFIIGLFNKMTFVYRAQLAGMLQAVQKVVSIIPKMGGLADKIQLAIDALKKGIPTIDITKKKVQEMGDSFGAAADVIVIASEVQQRAMDDLTDSVTDNLQEQARVAQEAVTAGLQRSRNLETALRSIRLQANAQTLQDLRAAQAEDQRLRAQAAADRAEKLAATLQMQSDLRTSNQVDEIQRLNKHFAEVRAAAEKAADERIKIAEREAAEVVKVAQAANQARLALIQQIRPSQIAPGVAPISQAALAQQITDLESQIRGARHSVDPVTGLPNVNVGQGTLDLLAGLRETQETFFGKHGGIVPGTSGGPPVPAVLHPKELVLTEAQQRRSGSLTVIVNVQGDVIGIEDLDDHILTTVRDNQLAGGAI